MCVQSPCSLQSKRILVVMREWQEEKERDGEGREERDGGTWVLGVVAMAGEAQPLKQLKRRLECCPGRWQMFYFIYFISFCFCKEPTP